MTCAGAHAANGTVPGTLGALERQAGICQDAQSRFAFWITFRNSADPITDGVAELHRRIASKAP